MQLGSCGDEQPLIRLAMAAVVSHERVEWRNSFGVNPIALIANFTLRRMNAHGRLSGC